MSFFAQPGTFEDRIVAELLNEEPWSFPGVPPSEVPLIWERSRERVRDSAGYDLSARVQSDRGNAHFSGHADIEVAELASKIAGSGDRRSSTHLLVSIRAPFFAEHHEWEHSVELRYDGRLIDSRIFKKWYFQHQFFVDINDIEDVRHLELRANPLRVGGVRGESPRFSLELFVGSKRAIVERLERSAIWLFSSARAGSTWLGSDILCAGERARPIDEPGIGRMFAPLRWDAERFFDLGDRAKEYVESGFAFETGEDTRQSIVLPPFERAFKDMQLENQILSRRNFQLYHRLLRDVALEHVINEWGALDFERVVFKCPNDAQAADFIMRAFPRSHMIFLTRDGRDVIRSRFSAFGSEELAESLHSGLRRYAIAFYSHWWNFQTDIIANAYENHDPALRMLIRYKDLRANPGGTISELFRWLGYDATEREIASIVEGTALEKAANRGPDKPRQQGLVGGYRAFFSDEEIELMNAIMGPNLRKYGYEV